MLRNSAVVTSYVNVVVTMIDGGFQKEVSPTLLPEFLISMRASRGLGAVLPEIKTVRACRVLQDLWALVGSLLFPERFGEEIGNVYVQYLGAARESPRSSEKPGLLLLP